ncbi:MAG: IPT/TIG domain-containing protein [Paludibacter sp.]|nr:IPT/TIG domain-containing protein [Paludibacter sp.]
MKNTYKSLLWMMSIVSSFVFLLYFTSCVEPDITKIVDHDPSKPIAVTSFAPDSGRVATQMLIRGENFGGNKDSIAVFINNKKAAVIGVNPEGTLIYCIVPSLRGDDFREEGDIISAQVKVVVGNTTNATSDKQLVYTFTKNVSTFLGFTDQDGNTAIVDGAFERAQFQSPFWMSFDTDVDGPKDAHGKLKKNIYLIEENNGVRFIDMYRKEVSTIFRTGNGVGRPRTIAFTLNDPANAAYKKDTMIVANDAGGWGDIGTIVIPRDSVTRRFGKPGVSVPWSVVMHHKQCNGGAIHPISGDYWFNSYEKSQVYKVFKRNELIWRYGGPTADKLNEDGKEGTNFFFLVQDNNWEFNIQIAPSGNFAYIVSKNQHYIARMEYNFEKKAFERPQPFVGSQKRAGFKDGVGVGNTLFNQPQQGAFDKDDNFYVCDGENNCIRKVTPQGQVSTYAGRPENPGYSDGALRDAQFDGPFGIIYDDEINTFYIADRDNRRIRSIKVE